MAQNTSASIKSLGQESKSFSPSSDGKGKKRQTSPRLYFPLDAKALRTPFRAKVLQTIYEISHDELGDRITSTVVQAEADYDDPGHVTLVLAIWANIDNDEWSRANRAINDAVFEHTKSFDEDEWADYSQIIHFEILPLKV